MSRLSRWISSRDCEFKFSKQWNSLLGYKARNAHMKSGEQATSFPGSLFFPDAFGGKKRDPGNEVGEQEVFVKSSMKQAKSFRFLLSNQKLARALTSTPKTLTPEWRKEDTSCCLATLGSKIADQVNSWLRSNR